MYDKPSKDAARYAVRFLPERLKRELDFLSLSRESLFETLSELRLRIGRASSILLGGERIFLGSELGREELAATFARLCGGSLYAHRDTIANGYISLNFGVRVGISGQARYEDGRLVGISEVASLVFRIPERSIADCGELLCAFKRAHSGLLVYSSPGVGKTTALRSLALRLATGREALNVAVIDERLEFIRDDYLSASVDILRGYKKSDGMGVALRTLSPEVIIVDEIGGEEEAKAALSYVNSGVRFVASAHAGSYAELMKKKNLEPFFENAVFDVFVGIKTSGGKRSYEVITLD